MTNAMQMAMGFKSADVTALAMNLAVTWLKSAIARPYGCLPSEVRYGCVLFRNDDKTTARFHAFSFSNSRNSFKY